MHYGTVLVLLPVCSLLFFERYPACPMHEKHGLLLLGFHPCLGRRHPQLSTPWPSFAPGPFAGLLFRNHAFHVCESEHHVQPAFPPPFSSWTWETIPCSTKCCFSSFSVGRGPRRSTAFATPVRVRVTERPEPQARISARSPGRLARHTQHRRLRPIQFLFYQPLLVESTHANTVRWSGEINGGRDCKGRGMTGQSCRTMSSSPRWRRIGLGQDWPCPWSWPPAHHQLTISRRRVVFWNIAVTGFRRRCLNDCHLGCGSYSAGDFALV